jgi:hypothetical protein
MKILFDPGELRATAHDFRSTDGEIGGIARQMRSGGLGGMPPDVMAHVGATLVESEVRLVWHRERLKSHAADLERRAAYAEDPAALGSGLSFDFLDRAGLLHLGEFFGLHTPHSGRDWFDLISNANSGVHKAASWLHKPGYLTISKASKLWRESKSAPLIERVSTFGRRLPGYMDYQGRWVVGQLNLRELASLKTVKRVESVTKVLGRRLGLTGAAMDAVGAFGDDQQHTRSVAHSVEHAAITSGSSAVGSVVGASAGAAFGSVIPFFGTAVGGVVGSAVGGRAGKEVGKGAEKALHHFNLF